MTFLYQINSFFLLNLLESRTDRSGGAQEIVEIMTILIGAGFLVPVMLGIAGVLFRQLTLERARTKRARNILDAIGGWWFVWDVQKGVMACNEGFCQLVQVPGPRHPGINEWPELFEEPVREPLKQALQDLATHGKPFSKVCEIPSLGDFFEIRGHAAPSHRALVCIQPVTEDYFMKTHAPPVPTRPQVLVERAAPPLHAMLLESVVRHVPVMCWCYQPGTNRIVFCNQAYAEAMDSDPETVVTSGLFLVPPEVPGNRDRFHTHQHVVIKGERRLLDIGQICVDQHVIGYAFDVSEIEHYQNEIQKHLQGHQDVLELVSVPIAIYDARKKLQFFNTAYARLSGIDAWWLEQKPSLSEVLEELRVRRRLPEYADFPAYKKKLDGYFTSMMEPVEDLEHLPDDRAIRMVIYPHPLGGLLFVFEDVTDKLAMERRYNTLIDVQQETLDHLYEGVVVFGSDNRLKLSNPAFSKIWGLNPRQTEHGTHISHVVDAIKPYCHYGPDWEVFKTNIISNVTDRIPKSGRFERTDSTILSFSYVPLPDGGHLLSYFDVTDTSKVEHALRERNEALEKADQMKSEFMANISCELREPLNNIIQFTEVLSRQYLGGLNDQQMEYTRAVLNSSQHLLSLINDLLDLASIEGGFFYLKKNFFDLYPLASSLLQHFQPKADEQGMTLEMECSPTIGLFWADETRIRQVVFNLIKNSISYAGKGALVRLLVRKDEDDLWIRVTDNGVGIPAAHLDRVFEKFERAAPHRDHVQGAGLGLALVRHFTHMHSGVVTIVSEEGQGTIVECRFPLQTPGYLPSPAEPPAPVPVPPMAHAS
jgi:signal transduction histidine kinase/PAS domain-containing protein